jgi:nitroreductase
MNKKQLLASILAFCLIAVMAHGQQSNCVTDLILKSYSARTFTSVPVSAGDLELILRCGIKAPSASNAQPWKFIVARETSLMQEMVSSVTPGNVLIVVCGSEARPSAIVDFDCGLATENMTIAAQALGLGARIYFSSLPKINSTMKQTLQIPDGYRAVAVLRVGHIESNVDAATAASPRNNFEDVVTFLR